VLKITILITGGAGYIGSHIVRLLLDNNENVVVVDNLKTGHRKAVPDECYKYYFDIRNKTKLDEVFKYHKIEAVIHFAADSIVKESMEYPSEYYNNNVYGTLCLLDVMKINDVSKVIFSSSAAVYGEPKKIPIQENDELGPSNVYGETKLTMEKMMKWFDLAYGIKYTSLRYFNAAGAYPTGEIGEAHDPETHLIPLVLQVPLGKKEKICIFGNNYPTKDGTCIRDFIHVMDLADAHYKALNYFKGAKYSEIFNLGSGEGCSVNEVIEIAKKVTKQEIITEIKETRPGDPAVLIASSEKAKRILGWKPKYNSIEKMIADAWNWHKKNPDGFHLLNKCRF